MKQLKRLDVSAPRDAFARAQRMPLRYLELSEDGFRALEREQPELVVSDREAVLVGQPRQQRIDLHYAFPNRDAFARQFAGMFSALAQAIDAEEAPLGFRFRLTERSSRPYVEPVLIAQAFELRREWMEMSLAELPDGGPDRDEVAPGFTLRPVRIEDVEAIVRLEEVAFPNPALTPDSAQGAMDTAARYGVLEETTTGNIAGSLLTERQPPAAGHVASIAVHPDFQRRGLGEATLRWALASFRRDGLRRATLTVTVDNAPAIALYRKLGFAPGNVGLDYVRPTDDDEARRVLEKRRTSRIKFGGWR